MIRLLLPGPDDTRCLGEALARTAPVPAMVHLQGELGAGKSTLARAWLRHLGVEGAIRSPTYTLVERYAVPAGEAWHLDLYRIGDAAELEFLGLDAGDPVLWLVEWPERAPGGLVATDLAVKLALHQQGRLAQLEPGTPAGEAWVAGLVQDPELQHLLSLE